MAWNATQHRFAEFPKHRSQLDTHVRAQRALRIIPDHYTTKGAARSEEGGAAGYGRSKGEPQLKPDTTKATLGPHAAWRLIRHPNCRNATKTAHLSKHATVFNFNWLPLAACVCGKGSRGELACQDSAHGQEATGSIGQAGQVRRQRNLLEECGLILAPK